MAGIPGAPPPSSEQAYINMFKEAQAAAPKDFPKDSWYIIVAATLITADGGAHLGELYQFLISELGPNSTREERRRVSKRLRAIIIKEWTLVGMPRASDGFFSLAKVEPEGDEDQEWDRHEYGKDYEKATKRTKDWWIQVFGEKETAAIGNSYGTNPDFAWTVDFACYGLFLADLSVLGPLENELVILSSVMGQGAAHTTITHLRGIRRIGVNLADSEAVQRVIEIVAQFQGKDTSGWHRPKEVAHLFEDSPRSPILDRM